MADNSTLPVNSGTEVFANDDVSSVKYPRVKLNVGADGRRADYEVKVTDVTLSLDTSVYSSGDVLADTQVIAACVVGDDIPGILHSLMVIDQDDQKAALTVYFLSANNSMGTENSAPSISDANAVAILGFVDIAVADYKDLGGVSVASKTGLGMPVMPASGTDDIYVAVVNGTGVPTYTASGVKLRVGII